MVATDGPSARERLESEIGDRLATLLRAALSSEQTFQHSWEATVAAATASTDPGVRPHRPDVVRIVALHPEHSSAVSLGMSRSGKQRMVSPVGIGETQARKAASNEERRRESSTADQIELACECRDDTCDARIALTADEYAFLRTVPGYFAVAPDHIGPDDHVIVGEGDRYAIVE
jgi:hypothetical protein